MELQTCTAGMAGVTLARSEDVARIGSTETLRLIAPVADVQQAQDGDGTRSGHRRRDCSISGYPPPQCRALWNVFMLTNFGAPLAGPRIDTVLGGPFFRVAPNGLDGHLFTP